MATTLASLGARAAALNGTASSRTPIGKLVASHPRLPSARLLPSKLAKRSIGSTPMASSGRSGMVCMASGDSMAAMIEEKNKENPLMVYSKTYCPFCTEVKRLFTQLGVEATIVELDNLADGDAVQSALSGVSGSRTVPQVFIGGQFLGGCDDTMAASRSGKLQELLADAGIAM